MNHINRRLTPRTAEDARLQAAIDRGVAHLRANPGTPSGESVAVVIAAMVRA